MGGMCPKKEKEASQGSVHPSIKSANLRDEEAEKINQSDSRMPLSNEEVAPKTSTRPQEQKPGDQKPLEQTKPQPISQPNPQAKGTPVSPEKPIKRTEQRMDTRTVPQVNVISQYQIQAEQVDPATKQRMVEAGKKSEVEQAALLGRITEAKKEKKNQHDDFSIRWKEELDRRGFSNEKNYYDATDLKNQLNESLTPTLKNELAVPQNPAADQGTKTNSVDTLRTDYILAADPKAFLQLFNALRSNPKAYAEIIKLKYLNMLDPFFCHKTTLRTYEEGKAALSEAVKALESQAAASAVTLDAGLCVAAHIQAKRQAYEKRVFGEDRASQVAENVGRFAQLPQGSELADCNVSTQVLNYEDIMINLFVSDGDMSRRNRSAMAKEGFSKCGFGIFQRTKKSPIFCTLILASKNAQGDKSKIPKDLLQDASASQL